MPPSAPLAESEKSVLKAWLAAGAGWGTDPIDTYQATTSHRAGRDWWSLQPLSRPAPPSVRHAGRVRTLIDRFILNKLEANGLTLAAEADRRVLIRRVCFDLTGLPPHPAEIDAFVADPSPAAYEKMVERYLASPQYGVRWARWWLDLARYGESNGYEFDEFRPAAWRYRDWVVDSFNRDLPYNEFARLQLAGDVLHPNDADSVAATGFLVAGAYDTVGQAQQSLLMRAVVRSDEIEDLVATVGQTFLGVTANCGSLPRPQVRPDPPEGILRHRLGTIRRPARRARPVVVRRGRRRRAQANRGPAVARRSDRAASREIRFSPAAPEATPPTPRPSLPGTSTADYST